MLGFSGYSGSWVLHVKTLQQQICKTARIIDPSHPGPWCQSANQWWRQCRKSGWPKFQSGHPDFRCFPVQKTPSWPKVNLFTNPWPLSSTEALWKCSGFAYQLTWTRSCYQGQNLQPLHTVPPLACKGVLFSALDGKQSQRPRWHRSMNVEGYKCEWFVDLGDFADSMNSSSLKGKQYDMCMTKSNEHGPTHEHDSNRWGSLDVLEQSLGLCIFTGHHLSNLPNARVHASRHDHALSRRMVRKHPMWMISPSTGWWCRLSMASLHIFASGNLGNP